jgi:hypothetical protein
VARAESQTKITVDTTYQTNVRYRCLLSSYCRSERDAVNSKKCVRSSCPNAPLAHRMADEVAEFIIWADLSARMGARKPIGLVEAAMTCVCHMDAQ